MKLCARNWGAMGGRLSAGSFHSRFSELSSKSFLQSAASVPTARHSTILKELASHSCRSACRTNVAPGGSNDQHESQRHKSAHARMCRQPQYSRPHLGFLLGGASNLLRDK